MPARPAPITSSSEPKCSGSGSLEQQLQLSHGSTADMEDGPARREQDRGNHQNQPSVHGKRIQYVSDLKESTFGCACLAPDLSSSVCLGLAAGMGLGELAVAAGVLALFCPGLGAELPLHLRRGPHHQGSGRHVAGHYGSSGH